MNNKQIDRLGEQLVEQDDQNNEETLIQLQEYRKSFQKPLAEVFEFVLENARKLDKHSVVTYRIKRIDTIINKLKRFEGNSNGKMKLSRMWDVAGCRCIFKSDEKTKLYKLLEIIKNEYGKDCKINDYVVSPKKTGYRCIHIYVKDHKTQKPIEIQIRNMEQHNWATLVEIVDVLYSSKEKFSSAQSDLGRFLSLYSHRLDGLSLAEYNEMISIENKREIFETMSTRITNNNLSVRNQWLSIKNIGDYYVIQANNQKTIIDSYKTFAKAEAAYFEKYTSNNEYNIVLTHIPNATFEIISTAYSNYILSMHAFFDDFRKLVSEHIILDLQKHQLWQLHKDFNQYRRNSICHWKNLKLEILQMFSTSLTNANTEQLAKWKGLLQSQVQHWGKETGKLVEKIAFETSGSFLLRIYFKNRFKRLSIQLSEV